MRGNNPKYQKRNSGSSIRGRSHVSRDCFISCGIIFYTRHHVVNVVLRAQENGRSLMNVLRHDVQNINFSVCRETTGFLDYKGHWYALVQQPQLKYGNHVSNSCTITVTVGLIRRANTNVISPRIKYVFWKCGGEGSEMYRLHVSLVIK